MLMLTKQSSAVSSSHHPDGKYEETISCSGYHVPLLSEPSCKDWTGRQEGKHINSYSGAIELLVTTGRNSRELAGFLSTDHIHYCSKGDHPHIHTTLLLPSPGTTHFDKKNKSGVILINLLDGFC